MIVGKKKSIAVLRKESNFDKACEEAYRYAVMHFDIDECGHSRKFDFERSTDSINIKFKGFEHSGGMGGDQLIYRFDAWIDRNTEDEDE